VPGSQNIRKESLVLQYKTVKKAEECYLFNLSAKKKPEGYSLAAACELINRYPAENRNCQIIEGRNGNSDRIGLKSGKGRLPMCPVPNPDKPIKLYTKLEYCPQQLTYIRSNDSEFRSTRDEPGFLERHRDMIYAIDKAIIVNYERLKIETPYGIAGINDLSTGCKTILNILRFMELTPREEVLVNVDESGDNVLKRILALVAGSNISLYISHNTDCIDDKHKFDLNGAPMPDVMAFLDAIWEDTER